MGYLLCILIGGGVMYWGYWLLKSSTSKKERINGYGILFIGLIIVFCSIALTIIDNDNDDYYESHYDRSEPNFKATNPSRKCNIQSHNCTGYVDNNNDNYCDVCFSHGFKCHSTRH